MADSVERCRALIQRCSHHDKDERYMAISDLRGEIESLDTIDVSMQTQMRQAMLKRLEDSSSDVQQIAVNCFSSMVEKFDPSQVIEIIATLSNLSDIQNGSQLKEVYAEALRAILEHVPLSLGEQVSNLLLPVLLDTLGTKKRPTKKRNERSEDREGTDARFWCLMLLQTVLEQFVGCSIGDENCRNILSILVRLLREESDYNNSLIPSVVASFSNFCPSQQLADLVQEITKSISSNPVDEMLSLLVLTLSDVARKAGSRLVQHSSTIVPVLEKVVTPVRAVNFEDAKEEMVAIRYQALVVLECLVRFGPQYVAPYCTSFLNIALTLMTLDPNYVESHDAVSAMDEFDGDDWGLEPDMAPEEDAGDTTWKVRLAALRLLSEWINCRTFKCEFVSNISCLFDRLLDRFDERDAAVQAQVFDTFSTMLKRMSNLSSEVSIDDIASRYLAEIMLRLRSEVMSAKLDVKRSTANTLLAMITLFGTRLFDDSSEVLSFALTEIVDKSDTSVQLIGLETLKAVISLLPSSRLLQMNIEGVVQALISVMDRDSNKLSVAPFETSAALCRKICSSGQQPEIPEMILLFQPLFEIGKKLPSCLTERHLHACSALAEFCSCFGGSLNSSDFQNSLELFLSCVEIRNVDSSGLQCLTVMANSIVPSVHKALEPFADRIFKTLLELVGQKDKDANITSSYLSTMSAFISRHPMSIAVSMLKDCLNICINLDESPVITSMHNLCANILSLKKQRGLTPERDVIHSLTDQAIRVLSNADSQDRPSLQSSQALLVAICQSHSDAEYKQLITRLMEIGSSPDVQPAPLGSAIASCFVARFDQVQLLQEISNFLSSINNNTKPGFLQLCLIIVGETARLTPLPESLLKELFSFLSSYINYGDEHVKASAATSLGACTSANPTALLPSLLDRVVQSETVSVCFPLHALKEVLVSVEPQRLSFDVAKTIFPVLMRYADSENEGVRAIVSECIGKLLAIDHSQLATQIQSSLQSSSPLLRASLVTAIKFCYAQRRDENIPAESLLPLLQDSDLSVKRQTYLALITVLNSTRSISNLDKVLEHLDSFAVGEIPVKKELIRKIDFGAFQETVDEGLLLRQAAHSCLKTMTELYPENLPAKFVIIELAKHGVSDPDIELQISSYDTMASMASSLTPGVSISFFEELPTYFLPAVKQYLAQVKRNPSDSDTRRVLSAFIIALHKLHSLSGVKADCPKFHTFYLQVLKTALLSDILKELNLLDNKL